jgi:hypothetical protein
VTTIKNVWKVSDPWCPSEYYVAMEDEAFIEKHSEHLRKLTEKYLANQSQIEEKLRTSWLEQQRIQKQLEAANQEKMREYYSMVCEEYRKWKHKN